MVSQRARESLVAAQHELNDYPGGEYHWRLVGRINRLTNLCACLENAQNTLDNCKATFEADHQRMLAAVAAIEAKFADLKKRRDECDDSANPATCEPALATENTQLLAERDRVLSEAAGKITVAGEVTTTTASTTTTATTAATTTATTLAPGQQQTSTTSSAEGAATTTTSVAGATTTATTVAGGAVTTSAAQGSVATTTSALQGALAELSDLREKLAACEEKDDDVCAEAVQSKIADAKIKLANLGDVSVNVTGCSRSDARFLELFTAFTDALRKGASLDAHEAAISRHLHRQKKHAARLRRKCRATSDRAERRECYKAYRKFRAHLRLKRRLRRSARRCGRRSSTELRQQCLDDRMERAKRLLKGNCRRETCQEVVSTFVRALEAMASSISAASDTAAIARDTASVAALVEEDRVKLQHLREKCAALVDPGHKRRCYRYARMVRHTMRAKKRAERRVSGCQFKPDADARTKCSKRALRRVVRSLNRACAGGRRRCNRKADRFAVVMGRFAELVVNGTDFVHIHRAHGYVTRHILRHARRVRRMRRRCHKYRSIKAKKRCFRQVKQQRRLVKAKRRYHNRLRRCRRMVSDQASRMQCAKAVMSRVERKFRASCARRSRFHTARHYLRLEAKYAMLQRRNNDPDAIHRTDSRIRRMIKELLKRQRRLLRRCRRRRSARAKRRCRRRIARAVRKLKHMRRMQEHLRRCRHRQDPAEKERCINRIERKAHRMDPAVAQRCHRQRKYMRLMRRLARLIRKQNAERVALLHERVVSFLTRWQQHVHKMLRDHTCRRSQRCRFGASAMLRHLARMMKHEGDLKGCTGNGDQDSIRDCTRVHVNAARRTARCGYRAHRGSRHKAAIRQHLSQQLARLAACTDDECRASANAELKRAQDQLQQAEVAERLADQNREARLQQLADAKVACKTDAACLANVTASINTVFLEHAAETQQDAQNAVAYQALREIVGACPAGDAGSACRQAAHDSYRADINQRVEALNGELREEARNVFLSNVAGCNATYFNATNAASSSVSVTKSAVIQSNGPTTPAPAPPAVSAALQQAKQQFDTCSKAAKDVLVTKLVQLGTQQLAAKAQEQVRQCAAVPDPNGCIAAVNAAAVQDQAVMQADAQAQADAIMAASLPRSMIAAGAKLMMNIVIALVLIALLM